MDWSCQHTELVTANSFTRKANLLTVYPQGSATASKFYTMNRSGILCHPLLLSLLLSRHILDDQEVDQEDSGYDQKRSVVDKKHLWFSFCKLVRYCNIALRQHAICNLSHRVAAGVAYKIAHCLSEQGIAIRNGIVARAVPKE